MINSGLFDVEKIQSVTEQDYGNDSKISESCSLIPERIHRIGQGGFDGLKTDCQQGNGQGQS